MTLEDYGITYKFEHNVNPSWWNNYYMVEDYYVYYKSNVPTGNFLVREVIFFRQQKAEFVVTRLEFGREAPMIVNNELTIKNIDCHEFFEFQNLTDAPSFVITNPELKAYVEKTLSKDL